MNREWHRLKVFDPVVCLYPIPVVDNLFRFEESPVCQFPQEPVFGNKSLLGGAGMAGQFDVDVPSHKFGTCASTGRGDSCVVSLDKPSAFSWSTQRWERFSAATRAMRDGRFICIHIHKYTMFTGVFQLVSLQS
jgi:hypothetical protein